MFLLRICCRKERLKERACAQQKEAAARQKEVADSGSKQASKYAVAPDKVVPVESVEAAGAAGNEGHPQITGSTGEAQPAAKFSEVAAAANVEREEAGKMEAGHGGQDTLEAAGTGGGEEREGEEGVAANAATTAAIGAAQGGRSDDEYLCSLPSLVRSERRTVVVDVPGRCEHSGGSLNPVFELCESCRELFTSSAHVGPSKSSCTAIAFSSVLDKYHSQ